MRNVPLWFNIITYPGLVAGYEFFELCQSLGMRHEIARHVSMAVGTGAMCFAGALLGCCANGVVHVFEKRS